MQRNDIAAPNLVIIGLLKSFPVNLWPHKLRLKSDPRWSISNLAIETIRAFSRIKWHWPLNTKISLLLLDFQNNDNNKYVNMHEMFGRDALGIKFQTSLWANDLHKVCIGILQERFLNAALNVIAQAVNTDCYVGYARNCLISIIGRQMRQLFQIPFRSQKLSSAFVRNHRFHRNHKLKGILIP